MTLRNEVLGIIPRKGRVENAEVPKKVLEEDLVWEEVLYKTEKKNFQRM